MFILLETAQTLSVRKQKKIKIKTPEVAKIRRGNRPKGFFTLKDFKQNI